MLQFVAHTLWTQAHPAKSLESSGIFSHTLVWPPPLVETGCSHSTAALQWYQGWLPPWPSDQVRNSPNNHGPWTIACLKQSCATKLDDRVTSRSGWCTMGNKLAASHLQSEIVCSVICAALKPTYLEGAYWPALSMCFISGRGVGG